MDLEAGRVSEPGSDASPPEGRGAAWLCAVLFVVVCGSAGVLSVLVDEALFTGRWWLFMGIYVAACLAVGAGMGLALRRNLGWRSSAWAARRQQLSWRQRLQIGWANERARAVDDPMLAQAAVERGEFGLRAMARMGRSYLLVARVTAGLGVMIAAGLMVLAVWDWDNNAVDWLVVAIAVSMAALATALPWLHRRIWGWVMRRAEKALAANRAAAARADADDQ